MEERLTRQEIPWCTWVLLPKGIVALLAKRINMWCVFKNKVSDPTIEVRKGNHIQRISWLFEPHFCYCSFGYISFLIGLDASHTIHVIHVNAWPLKLINVYFRLDYGARTLTVENKPEENKQEKNMNNNVVSNMLE